jgi:four helix bundle protein
MLNPKPNPLYEKAMLLNLYVGVVEQELMLLRRFNAADQLARAARAVMNNISEAQSSESRRDFVHRLKAAQRELNESSSMLSSERRHSAILQRHGHLLHGLAFELARLLAASVATAKRNMQKE